MSKPIKANYQETYLFPPAVEDWVGARHPARFIREVVEALDLEGLGFGREEERKPEEAGQGRPYYSDDLLLKAWIYGYMNRIRSSRKLEQACREHLSLIWLLGRNEPDHNTLWRFWKKNRKRVGKVYRKILAIAMKADLIGLALHAVDGSKIRANASMERGLYRKKLEKKLEKVEELIDRIEREIEEAEERESGAYELPPELEDRQALRERIRKSLEKLDEAEVNQLSLTDPQARVMPCEGKKKFAYNAQAVVDEKSGMIVAQSVDNDDNDHGHLVPMLEHTKANLGARAEETVADGGYRSDEGIGKAAEKKYSVLVRLYPDEGEKAGPYHASRFQYDPEQDCCICPQGKKLVREGTIKSRHGHNWMEKTYRCKQGASCPVLQECTRDPMGRKISIGPYYQAVSEQRKKHREPGSREKLAKRKTIVERAFAEIKEHMEFRRWTFRGIERVQAQWTFVCLAYNLRKLYQYWYQGQVRLMPG